MQYALNLYFSRINSLHFDSPLLQETKVSNELFPHQFFKDFGYNFIHHEGEKTGYNGVAIIAKSEFEVIPKIEFINDARHLAINHYQLRADSLMIAAKTA